MAAPMKPSQNTNRVAIWRFRDTGIEIRFERATRLWCGVIAVAGAAPIALPYRLTDMLVLAHGLEKFT